MKVSPTLLGNRIESLDMLRGFALLGIFIANMLTFHSPYFYIDPHTYFSTPGDQFSYKIISIFIEASFYPIFAMLFGYGLQMQYEKSVVNKTPFAPIMAKRLAILMAFGLIHALFIWSGDILFTYAIMGFIMIGVVRIPKKWLFSVALVVYIIPTLLLIGGTYFVTKMFPDDLMEGYSDIQRIEQAITAYGHGSYVDALLFRIPEWLLIGLPAMFMGVFMVLPLIMLGAVFAKVKLFECAAQFKGRIALVTLLSFVTGIVIKSLPYLDEPTYYYKLTQQLIGGPILAIGYAGVILLLCQLTIFQKVFRPISKAGRMSLTTYLTQSIVATLIFYKYGLGLYGKVDIETGTLMAIGIFILQVIFAELWLMKFKMGPFEWVWRKLTYGKNLTKKEEKVQVL